MINLKTDLDKFNPVTVTLTTDLDDVDIVVPTNNKFPYTFPYNLS